METMRDLLGGLTGNELQRFEAHRIATLPMRLGGLGLRSASRMRHIQHVGVVGRFTQVLAHLAIDQRATGCLGELQEATDKLDHEGFVSRSEWTALRDGARPPQSDASAPDE